MKVKLGNTYKDSISGYEGVAVARTVYLYGCERILIAPIKLKPDGDFLPDCWFDEAQLVSVRSKTKVAKRGKRNGPAGPSRSVPSNRDPMR
jgi:hypothetical protein